MSNSKKIKTMKKVILSALVLGIFAVSAFALGTDVPDAVKTKFASLYPTIKKAKWGKEENNYEATFELDEVETSVLFDASGNVLETETEIAASSLPSWVADYITKNYPGQKIKETAKIVDDKGTVMYEAEVKAGDLIFDASGNFVKKVVEAEDDDDDEKGKDKD